MTSDQALKAAVERVTRDAPMLIENYCEGDDRNRLGHDLRLLLTALSSQAEVMEAMAKGLGCVEARETGSLVVTIPADDPSACWGGVYAFRCDDGSEIGPDIAQRFGEIIRTALSQYRSLGDRHVD